MNGSAVRSPLADSGQSSRSIAFIDFKSVLMFKFSLKILVVNSAIFLLFLIDRFLKQLAITLPVNDGFFVFEKNYSLAFGLLIPEPIEGLSRILIYILIINILLILSFLLVQAYQKKNLFLIISFTLIFLGALSNLIDRFSYGYVIDYLKFFISLVFNLSDVMIVGGVGLVIASTFRIQQSKM